MNLNEEEKKEAGRLFNLRRRIYDYRNIKDWPEDDNLMDFDIDVDSRNTNQRHIRPRHLCTRCYIQRFERLRNHKTRFLFH